MNNYARQLINAKDMGRFEGFRAYMDVAIVAIHNIAADEEIPEEYENIIISKLDAEIARILTIDDRMCAEDIGAAVVQYAEKRRKELKQC